MKKPILLLFVLILNGLAYATDTTHPLAFLYGDWVGSGKTSGLAAELKLSWEPVVKGRFVTIHLYNRMTSEADQQIEFEGIGYYRADDELHFTGVWIDSQGHIHPLKAVREDESLLVTWGTEETELGRSVYRILSRRELEVIDSIRNQAGEWQEFGRAILKRQ